MEKCTKPLTPEDIKQALTTLTAAELKYWQAQTDDPHDDCTHWIQHICH